MTTTEQMLWDTAAVPVVIAYVKSLKRYLPKGQHAQRWTILLPLASVVLGVVYALFFRPGCEWSKECIAAGFMIGLSSSGLAAGVRHTAEAIQKKRPAIDPTPAPKS